MTDQILSLLSVYSFTRGGNSAMVYEFRTTNGPPPHCAMVYLTTNPCTLLSPSCTLSSNIKLLGYGSLVPLISARMGLLVLLAASLAGVHGFGLGPSLEWKAGDAEMWGQVKTVQVLRSYHPLL